MAGGPCWLSMRRNNEDSLQPAGVEKGDVREAPTGATKGNTNSDSASRTVVHKISVQDPVLVHGQAADHSFHVSHDKWKFRSLESRENIDLRFKMVLDHYNNENIHNEFEESFLMVHLDSIGIMGALVASLFIMFISYKLCKSKGVKRYVNVCCSRCCKTRGTAGREEKRS